MVRTKQRMLPLLSLAAVLFGSNVQLNAAQKQGAENATGAVAAAPKTLSARAADFKSMLKNMSSMAKQGQLPVLFEYERVRLASVLDRASAHVDAALKGARSNKLVEQKLEEAFSMYDGLDTRVAKMNQREARSLREKASVASEKMRTEATRSQLPQDEAMMSVAALHAAVIRSVHPEAFSKGRGLQEDVVQVWQNAKPWQRWAAGVGTGVVVVAVVGGVTFLVHRKLKKDSAKKDKKKGTSVTRVRGTFEKQEEKDAAEKIRAAFKGKVGKDKIAFIKAKKGDLIVLNKALRDGNTARVKYQQLRKEAFKELGLDENADRAAYFAARAEEHGDWKALEDAKYETVFSGGKYVKPAKGPGPAGGGDKGAGVGGTGADQDRDNKSVGTQDSERDNDGAAEPQPLSPNGHKGLFGTNDMDRCDAFRRNYGAATPKKKAKMVADLAQRHTALTERQAKEQAKLDKAKEGKKAGLQAKLNKTKEDLSNIEIVLKEKGFNVDGTAITA